MGKVTMSGRERMRRALERREQDRVPRHEAFWPDTLRKWQREQGFVGDNQTALDALQGDLCELGWCWPIAFPGKREVLSEDAETQVVKDGHGAIARFWKNRNGTPEHIGFDCDTREKWDKIYRPAMVARAVQFNFEEAKKAYARGREKGRFTYVAGIEGFEQTRKIIGDEVAMMAFAEDPEWIMDISRTTADITLSSMQALLDQGIKFDGLWIFGDMAYKNATMCSPAMYKELVWPDHKRLAQWAHEHGMKFIFHTDGDVNAVMDLYVEAGMDCLQPLEVKAGMDIRKLVPKYGKKLSFFGNVDAMILSTNNLELIEQEIVRKLEAGKSSRGYVFHSDHSVPPTVTWATYQKVIEMVDRYGWYE